MLYSCHTLPWRDISKCGLLLKFSATFICVSFVEHFLLIHFENRLHHPNAADHKALNLRHLLHFVYLPYAIRFRLPCLPVHHHQDQRKIFVRRHSRRTEERSHHFLKWVNLSLGLSWIISDHLQWRFGRRRSRSVSTFDQHATSGPDLKNISWVIWTELSLAVFIKKVTPTM